MGVLSLVCNLIWMNLTGMVHVNDVIHILACNVYLWPITRILGGGIVDPRSYLPLAIVIDVLIGILWVKIISKFIKGDRVGGYSSYRRI